MSDNYNIINYGENDSNTREVLGVLRDKYGDFNQILVSIEELNELACVLAKIPRYSTVSDAMSNLYDRIIDEVADVLIVMNHVIEICKLDNSDIIERIKMKLNRIERWLESGNGISATITDREVL